MYLVAFGAFFLLLSAMVVTPACTLNAQTAPYLDVGSERERAAETAALADGVDRARERRANALSVDANLGLRHTSNGGFPTSFEGGTAWTGRGSTLSLAPDIGVRWQGISLRLAPELWAAENLAVPLIPHFGAAPNPYVDAMRPGTIDLPQSLGRGAVARLEASRSALDVSGFGARVALTAAPRRIGPGLSHGIILSPDGPAFPRVEVGTASPVSTPIGDFQLTLAAGKIGQTAFAPARRVNARSGSFFEGRWRPLSDARLELGASRFYHHDWDGARLGDLIAPFGSLFFDAQTFGGAAADNQMLSVFGVVRSPALGLELWAEVGFNDRQTDARELALELEHNTAWLFGLRRAWRAAGGTLWALEATAASARVPPIDVLRPQATFYEHDPISQGHTARGQLLGTRLLERNGGAELRFDRFDARGRLGVVLATRDLAQARGLEVPETRLRRDWSLLAEWARYSGSGLELFVRAGAVADVNRHPERGDAYGATLTTGILWRPCVHRC